MDKKNKIGLIIGGAAAVGIALVIVFGSSKKGTVKAIPDSSKGKSGNNPLGTGMNNDNQMPVGTQLSETESAIGLKTTLAPLASAPVFNDSNASLAPYPGSNEAPSAIGLVNPANLSFSGDNPHYNNDFEG